MKSEPLLFSLVEVGEYVKVICLRNFFMKKIL